CRYTPTSKYRARPAPLIHGPTPRSPSAGDERAGPGGLHPTITHYPFYLPTAIRRVGLQGAGGREWRSVVTTPPAKLRKQENRE
ncbi:hypothetical protein EVAR_61075_1, partial [Eumeta japonica]